MPRPRTLVQVTAGAGAALALAGASLWHRHPGQTPAVRHLLQAAKDTCTTARAMATTARTQFHPATDMPIDQATLDRVITTGQAETIACQFLPLALYDYAATTADAQATAAASVHRHIGSIRYALGVTAPPAQAALASTAPTLPADPPVDPLLAAHLATLADIERSIP